MATPLFKPSAIPENFCNRFLNLRHIQPTRTIKLFTQIPSLTTKKLTTMPRNGIPSRSISPQTIPPQTIPPQLHSTRTVRPPKRIQLRSVQAPLRPTIEKKRRKPRLQDLTDALHARILNFCNLKPQLKGRYLSTVREAFTLACTNSRFFNLFCSRIRHVDAFFPARRGYPAPCMPDYLQQLQMCWLARLAHNNLNVLRLPDYQDGSADVLVAAEFCCRSLTELSFTDNGSVFPSLANSLFTSCRQISKIEIRAPEQCTIFAMSKGLCNFKEVVLLDVRCEILNMVCTLIEMKGSYMNTLRVACDIITHFDEAKRLRCSEDDLKMFRSFCHYIKRHSFQELPQVYELDISTSKYHALAHDPHDTLDRSDKPGQLFLSQVGKLVERERNTKKVNLGRRPKRRIRMLRFRCIDIDEMHGLLVNHLPVQEAMNLDTVFPGGSACFNFLGEMEMRIGSLQMGMHVTDRKTCFQGTKHAKVVNLGSVDIMKRYFEEVSLKREVGKLLMMGCENIETIRGVFAISREFVDTAYQYIKKAMKFAMLTRTLEVSYEIVKYGHGIDEGFVRMIGTWRRLEMLRLVNPGNYGEKRKEISEGECMEFLGGLQWLIELLKDCKKLRCIWLEELGDVTWRNVPKSKISLEWCIRNVKEFEEVKDVDCGSVVARLKRWLSSCKGTRNERRGVS